MSAVFNENQIVFFNDLHDGVHVGHVAAHVGHEQHFCPGLRGFLVQIFSVHCPLAVALDENGNGTSVLNDAGYGMEGEGVGENGIAWLNTNDVECNEHS